MKKNILLFWLIVCSVTLLSVNGPAQDKVTGYFVVTGFGAKGDGVAKDTKEVQKAIDVCAEKGGGTVFFPAGTYLCGSLHLKSRVELMLSHGAELKMSPDINDFDVYEKPDFKNAADKETSYFHFALIWAEDAEEIAISGTGIINCNRTKRGGPKPIALKRCRFVSIQDITIKNAPNYNISMLGTDDVKIKGVTILNGFSDGIDPDGCQNVQISDCNIDCFDDAIVPKASFSLGYLRPVLNLAVTNCILASNCNAFKLGTESGGGFKNITFSNSVIYKRKVGKNADAGIALESVDGAEIEGIAITNITMQNVNSPIFIRLGNRGRDMEIPKPGYLRDVVISNIVVEKAVQPSMILGIPGYKAENITLNNLKIDCQGGGEWVGDIDSFPENEKDYPDADMFGDKLPCYAFFCRHAGNIEFNGIQLFTDQTDKRPAIVGDDLESFQINNFTAPSGENPPVIHLNKSRKIVLRSLHIPGNTADYLKFTAISNEEIKIIQ